jgi:hypothetical protein
MSIESIESMARSFDDELRALESLSGSSPLHRSPPHPTKGLGAGQGLPSLEHSFELAAAESERERLYDKMNDLTERVEELELHNRHQEKMLSHLKKRNKELERQLLHAADADPGEDDSKDDSVSFQDDDNKGNQMYRLQCKALELELQEMKMLLTQSQKKVQDSTVARDTVSTELQDERAKRHHAEKQKDAYAAAYRQALQHIEKWSS